MGKTSRLSLTLLFGVTTLLNLCTPAQAESSENTLIERGRYIAIIGNCNDCHTEGYREAHGKIPESQWLMGSDFGWRGPWGTTYPVNLRLFVSKLTEKKWIETAKTFKAKPPMPWYNVNDMKKTDLRALYYFIRSLGNPGQPAPHELPPGVEPKTPFAQFNLSAPHEQGTKVH